MRRSPLLTSAVLGAAIVAGGARLRRQDLLMAIGKK